MNTTLGSNALRTNVNGDVIFSQKFLPFGESRIQLGASNDVNNKFTDQYLDDESGNYYFNQRYYSQAIGRFLSADPLYSDDIESLSKSTQSMNIYAYANNNPVNLKDPTGLASVGLEWGESLFIMPRTSTNYSGGVHGVMNFNPFSDKPFFDLGYTETQIHKFGIGAMANVGFQVAINFGNESIQEMKGQSIGPSFDIPALGYLPFGFSGSASLGDGTFGISLGVKFNGLNFLQWGKAAAVTLDVNDTFEAKSFFKGQEQERSKIRELTFKWENDLDKSSLEKAGSSSRGGGSGDIIDRSDR